MGAAAQLCGVSDLAEEPGHGDVVKESTKCVARLSPPGEEAAKGEATEEGRGHAIGRDWSMGLGRTRPRRGAALGPRSVAVVDDPGGEGEREEPG